MRKSRCVGLLGGLGVGAATYYYAELAKAAEARGCELDLVMVHAEMARVLQHMQAADRTGLARYFSGLFTRMKAAGAELGVIPSVTSHFPIRELIAEGIMPMAVLFDPLIKEAARRGIKRVAVFGTRFVIQSDMYGFAPGLEFVQPQPEEVDFIHDTYWRLASDGKGTEEQYSALRSLALRLCERERLDAIILGGTDLALLFNQSNTDFPCLDCAALHVAAIADAL